MPTSRLLLAALFSTLLQACSSPSLDARSAPANVCVGHGQGQNSQPCRIDVVVTSSGAQACSVRLKDSGQALIDVAPGKSFEIWWQIQDSPGYVFAPVGADPSAYGIAFKSAQTDFDQPRAAGVNFSWRDVHAQGAALYEYGINVQNASGSIKCSMDPKISNL